MKLRILGNSIRLRLTQTEVHTLHQEGRVAEQITFSNAHFLKYRIVKKDISQMTAFFENNEIYIAIPTQTADAWATSAQISLETHGPLHDGNTLRILIEKDFKCLKVRKGEDETDMFPHPDADTHVC